MIRKFFLIPIFLSNVVIASFTFAAADVSVATFGAGGKYYTKKSDIEMKTPFYLSVRADLPIKDFFDFNSEISVNASKYTLGKSAAQQTVFESRNSILFHLGDSSSFFYPYLGAGPGLILAKRTINGLNSFGFEFAGHAYAGSRFKVGDGLSLFVEGDLVFLQSLDGFYVGVGMQL